MDQSTDFKWRITVISAKMHVRWRACSAGLQMENITAECSVRSRYIHFGAEISDY